MPMLIMDRIVHNTILVDTGMYYMREEASILNSRKAVGGGWWPPPTPSLVPDGTSVVPRGNIEWSSSLQILSPG